jgi:2-keto-3-deoxy-L-rhamnonate aldolase RhmA
MGGERRGLSDDATARRRRPEGGWVNSFRTLLATRQGPALGTWIKLDGELSCEIIAQAGFDFVVIDREHSHLSMDSAIRLVGTARLAGLPVLVRTPELDPMTYQRVLDAGAATILAPQMESADQVAAGLSYSRYPPQGSRGFSVTTRAGDWGMRTSGEHLHAMAEEICFIPQLESNAALGHLDEIVALDGLEAVFIGRSDLSLSTGHPLGSPELEAAVASAVHTCRAKGIAVGTAISDVASAQSLGETYDFVVVADDTGLLAHAARRRVLDMAEAFEVEHRAMPDLGDSATSKDWPTREIHRTPRRRR